MRTGLVALLGLVIGGAALPALATVYTYDFSSGGGGTVNPYWDGNAQNSGGESPAFRLGNSAAVTLFKVVLPGDLAGKTVASATLTIHTGETFTAYTGVKMFEINPTAPDWAVGDGTWGNRYGAKDNGATKYWANHVAAGGGVDWTGATLSAANDYLAAANGFSTTSVFGTLLDTRSVTDSSANTSFNVTAAVQDWANGATNRGLALSLLDIPGYDLGSAAHNFSATGAGLGLTITYNVVPEPATLGVLALSSLVLIRRRRSA